jgi:hypothetical protein
VGGDVPVNSEMILVINFVNLNIKSAQFFGDAHKNRMYVRVFIGVNTDTCITIYVCIVFIKKYRV